jgi:hypothetical protein
MHIFQQNISIFVNLTNAPRTLDNICPLFTCIVIGKKFGENLSV